MQTAVTYYTDDNYQEALDTFRREHPDHRGNVVCIPARLRRLFDGAHSHGARNNICYDNKWIPGVP
jgi:hypothetical protein